MTGKSIELGSNKEEQEKKHIKGNKLKIKP